MIIANNLQIGASCKEFVKIKESTLWNRRTNGINYSKCYHETGTKGIYLLIIKDSNKDWMFMPKERYEIRSPFTRV